MKSRTYWRGETAHIVAAMRATGNKPGIIAQWKASMEEWASRAQGADAEAVKAMLPLWQVRPFYTAEELAPLWPALAIATGFTDKWPAVPKSARRIAHELDFYGLPRLAYAHQYFICERVHYWRGASREEIMQELGNAQR